MDKVFVKDIIKEFSLEVITCEHKIDSGVISSLEVNRPGLVLGGYLEHFGQERIQVLGKAEIGYLDSLDPKERYEKLDSFLSYGFPCLIVARGLNILPELIELSQKYEIPILRSNDITSRFISGLIRFLNLHLSPMISTHGVFVEVYGEGILLTGESGIGKSETALELVKRGHRLIADDSVEIRKVSDKTLIGSPPKNIRYFIEIRGVGILDVRNLFGTGAVKMIENIDFVIHLRPESEDKEDDTDIDYIQDDFNEGGFEETEFTEILGIKVPSISIPIKPGKNLALLVEAAALNKLRKKLY